MMQKARKLNIPSSHLIALLVYLVLGLLLTNYFQYIWNKDEINYISIAEKYARGEFLIAPNALWAPLLSWLLAILIRFGLPSIFAAKLLSLMIGGFTFFAARSLSYTFEISDRIRTLVLYLLIPILLYCSLYEFTPDLLLAGLLTLYLSVILNRKYADRPWLGWLCGMLGALSYFAKSYAFFFFILHFSLISFLHYLINTEKSRKKVVLRNFASGLIVFFVLAAGWVYLLNLKYHEVTIGVNGKYNYRKAGPEYKGNPNGEIGFAPPPDATAISHWEDPYYYFSRTDLISCCLKPWSPLESRKAFVHQIKLIAKTTPTVISMYQGFSAFFILIIVASVLLCIVPKQQLILRIELVFGLVSFCLYSAGYSLFYVEERYLWAMWILIMLMGCYVLNVLLKTEFFADRIRRLVIIVIFTASFLFPPLVRLQSSYYKTNQIGRNINAFSNLLENDGLKGAKIASNTDYGTAVGVVYRLGAKFYGVATPYNSENEIVEELKKNGIEYYFVIYPQSDGDSSQAKNRIESPSLVKVKELQGNDLNLSVYSVVY